MPYLIDSDVFIQAKNGHYGFHFCPAFWDWLVARNAAGQVFSIERIRQELEAGHDELSAWATAQGAGFFIPPDATVAAQLPVVAAWATAPQQGYTAAAIATFLASGDYYLVAHALAYGHTVVTHEIAANTPTRIKIPNACAGVGVPCTNPFQMLGAAGALFVLAQPAVLHAALVVQPQDPLGQGPAALPVQDPPLLPDNP